MYIPFVLPQYSHVLVVGYTPSCSLFCRVIQPGSNGWYNFNIHIREGFRSVCCCRLFSGSRINLGLLLTSAEYYDKLKDSGIIILTCLHANTHSTYFDNSVILPWAPASLKLQCEIGLFHSFRMHVAEGKVYIGIL